MREVLGEALRNRRYLVMSGAYFVCGLQLIFLTTHLPNYLAICGADPMLSATALSVIGGVNIFGSWTAGWLGGRVPRNTFFSGLLCYLMRSAVLAIYFMIAADAGHHDCFRRRHGNAVVGRSMSDLVSGYVAELFGHPLHGHHPGHFLRRALRLGSVFGAWGWRTDFRYVRLLRSGMAYQASSVGVVARRVCQIMFGGPARI